MDDQDKLNSRGRKANAAQLLGQRRGQISDQAIERASRAERQTAGPDGGDSAELTRSIKPPRRPGP